MAKHYYNVEVVTTIPLDEDDVDNLESAIAGADLGVVRVTTEYVDSEG